MKSPTYCVIRVCSQLISTISILLNALGIIYFFARQNIYTVESALKLKPMLSFYDTSQYVCAINILFGLLANCSITSGIKFYMRIYSKLAYIQLGCSLSSIIYFYGFHKTTLLESVAIGIPKAGMDSSLGIMSVENSYCLAFREEVELAIKIFCVLQAATIVFNYLLVGLFKFAVSTRLEVTDKQPPKMVDARAGLNNKILEKSQVLELKNLALKGVAG